MHILLWILQGLLGFVFLGGGMMKLAMPEAKMLQNPKMAWVQREGITQARIAGGVEVLGALGLILPGVTGIAPVLTPVAAIGLFIIMVMAIARVHQPHGEPIALSAALGALSLLVAVGRFILPVS